MKDPTLFSIGVGDTGPSVVEDLKNGDGEVLGGTGVGLTGGSIRFRLYSSTGVLVIDRAATVVDAVTSRVRFDWAANDTTTLGAGLFFRRWLATLSDGTKVSVPDGIDGYPVQVTDPATAAPVAGRLVCTPWCSPFDVVSCAPCAGATFDPSLLTEMIDVASDLLFLLSGQQYPGICSDIGIRPNRVEWFGGRLIGSVSSTGEVFGLAPPRYSDFVSDRNLGAGPISEIRLPGYPVVAIQRVRVDGIVLPASAYKIDDDRWLARVDGQFWPVIQDLTKNPATDQATMDVDYTFGAAVPPMGRRAAAALTCQLAKACGGDSSCSLPPRTVSVVRQGLRVEKIDPNDYIENGKTGVDEADRFLKAVNPYGLRDRTSVMSVDTNWPAHRMR